MLMDMGLGGTGSELVSTSSGTNSINFGFMWKAFPKADGRWASDLAGARYVPVPLTQDTAKNL